MTSFEDRVHAGRELAARLLPYRSSAPIILALPRGGVPVAAEVARALGAPLELLVVRKLGVPARPELGMGAIAEEGEVFLDEELVAALGISMAEVAVVLEAERRELARRVERYRDGRPLPDVAGRTVILVDDGIATGGTARAALRVLRRRGAARLILAAPVAADDTARALAEDADEVVCVLRPRNLSAIGLWYRDFHQVSDAEVLAALREAGRGPAGGLVREVEIHTAAATLAGTLRIPAGARGLVLFAHGSGSSRHSPRNQLVASRLVEAGLGTLLFDLLTETEAELDEKAGEVRFDIPFLGHRLAAVTAWVHDQPEAAGLPLGYFGASTGAAAALVAAAALPAIVKAVVSRGGRPDLAARALRGVMAPTLLIVGGADETVLQLNRAAAAAMGGRATVTVIPGASHLFGEPGALEKVSRLARAFFLEHLPGTVARSASPPH